MSHDTSSDGVCTSAGKRRADAAVRHDRTHEKIVGNRLLTTPNPTLERDAHPITRVGAR